MVHINGRKTIQFKTVRKRDSAPTLKNIIYRAEGYAGHRIPPKEPVISETNTSKPETIRTVSKPVIRQTPVSNSLVPLPMHNNNVLLCGIGKLENKYIREWVEHHKALGFAKICLIDNNDKNGERFEEVIGDYIESGYVLLQDYRGVFRAQIKAYDDMYHKFGDEFDWIMFLDIDEHLHIPNHHSITDFVKQDKFKKFSNIRLNWKVFDDNDLVRVIDGNYNLESRFTRAIRDTNPFNTQTKPIMRLRLPGIKMNSAHGLVDETRIPTCNSMGIKCPNKICPGRKNWGDGWINHYMYKTIEEYVTNKMVRLWPTNFKNGGKGPGGLDIPRFWGINKRTNEKVALANKLKIGKK